MKLTEFFFIIISQPRIHLLGLKFCTFKKSALDEAKVSLKPIWTQLQRQLEGEKCKAYVHIVDGINGVNIAIPTVVIVNQTFIY